MNITQYKFLVYSTFGLISFITGLLVLIAYAKIKGLRKHPGMIIFWQVFMQHVIDLQITYSAVHYWITGESLAEFTCEVAGMFTICCFFISWNYSLSLSIEVLLTINSPTNRNYKKRSPLYHITSCFFGVLIVILVGISRAAGKSANEACFIKSDTWAAKLMFIPFVIYYPFSILGVVFSFIYIRQSRSESLKTLLGKHALFLQVYCLFWIPMSLSTIIQDDQGITAPWLSYISLTFSSISGLAINSVRLSDPAFIRWLRKRLGLRNSKIFKNTITSILNDATSESGTSLADVRISSVYESSYTHMFQSVYADAVLTSLVSVCLIFLKSSQEKDYMQEEKDFMFWSVDFYKQVYEFEMTQEDLSKIELDGTLINYCKNYIVMKFHCKIVEYAPLVFRHLRSIEGINDHDMIASFHPVFNISMIKKNTGNKGGRSSAFFYFTHDKKYIIKTITREEKKVLLEILLKNYHHHIENHPNSIIARLLGFFSLKFQNSHLQLIIMQNIFPPMNLKAIFDMKGSKLDRESIHGQQADSLADLTNDIIYKDLDFLRTQKNLYLSYNDSLALKQKIYEDSKLFSKLNIMDYSLLLGIGTPIDSNSKYYFKSSDKDKENAYVIGIIDYLQTYNSLKKIETISKRIIKTNVVKEDISSINSEAYSARFLKFVNSIISSD